jgi:hypothetical protein
MRAVIAGVLAGALASGCSSAGSDGPACTNESTSMPYGDAGILPLRSLPTGYPCAPDDLCYATIDDCSDWPDTALTPSSPSVNATPFLCDCPTGVWSCVDQDPTPPACVAPAGSGNDAGGAGDAS